MPVGSVTSRTLRAAVAAGLFLCLGLPKLHAKEAAQPAAFLEVGSNDWDFRPVAAARPGVPSASRGDFSVRLQAVAGARLQVQRRADRGAFVTVAVTEESRLSQTGLPEGVYEYRVRRVDAGPSAPFSAVSGPVVV